ncbi:3 beta-hydroxysteroid dehydrogenase/Delta 5--_4-isomerase [Rhipicephalus sanguineus]|uniref:3 beta-hydroxysteroid dehydrogenase/Delta 5-->4-isomerase n=1 Tax=Rhipicephalus sanguineus TaxID=34632 RepID=UPI0020C3812B|nr:3 beta-hydroxysteroid dehydrogenase/Delta 5-->4-isomerase [Rhipicephalus sanguineus]
MTGDNKRNTRQGTDPDQMPSPSTKQGKNAARRAITKQDQVRVQIEVHCRCQDPKPALPNLPEHRREQDPRAQKERAASTAPRDPSSAGATHRPVRVVLVTGSSGLLGHHVVRELQSHPIVQEVRLFDIRPFENGMGHPISKTMRHVVANLCDAQAVREAVSGADAVIHCASMVPVTVVEDAEAFEKVNVQGTRNVVDACVEESVPYLVYTGSVGVIQDGNRQAYDGPYARTKAQAEKMVLEASGCLLKNGLHRLHTFVIRLLPLYGELDQVFIPKMITWSRRTWKIMLRPGKTFSAIYAGNAASIHIRALDALCEDATLSGRCIVAADDTPTDSAAFMAPLVAGHDIRVTDKAVPYPVALTFAACTTGVARLLAKVFPGIRAAILLRPSDIRYIYSGTVFDKSEAEDVLAWRPKYSPQEAVKMSRSFYDAV